MRDSQPATAPEPEVHRADPAERRRTLWLLVLVTLGGVLLIAAVQFELGGIRARIANGEADLASGRFIWLARGSFVMLAAFGLLTAAVIARDSLAVLRERRYPHSGAKLLRDQLIRRGRPAVLLGRLGLALAAAFALTGCLGAAFGWRLLGLFA